MPEMEIDTSSSAIWHLLLDSDKASEEQLSEVYEEHERTGKAFTTVLYNYEIVSERELLELIAESLGTKVVDIKELNVSRDLVSKISPAIARMYGVVPLSEEEGVL